MPSPEEMQKMAEKMQSQGMGQGGGVPPGMPGLPQNMSGMPGGLPGLGGGKLPGQLPKLGGGYHGIGKKK
jgi:signal recognition particle subunit SRP54